MCHRWLSPGQADIERRYHRRMRITAPQAEVLRPLLPELLVSQWRTDMASVGLRPLPGSLCSFYLPRPTNCTLKGSRMTTERRRESRPTNCTLKGSRMTTERRGESQKPLSLLPTSPTWQISGCGRTLQSHQHSKSWPRDHRLLQHAAYVPRNLFLLGSIERTEKGRTPLQMRNFPGLHRQVCSER